MVYSLTMDVAAFTRQLIDIEGRRLVGEFVGGRDERAVAKIATVERAEAQVLERDAGRGLAAPRRLRALHEEGTEGLGGPFDRAEGRVQPIHERA